MRVGSLAWRVMSLLHGVGESLEESSELFVGMRYRRACKFYRGGVGKFPRVKLLFLRQHETHSSNLPNDQHRAEASTHDRVNSCTVYTYTSHK